MPQEPKFTRRPMGFRTDQPGSVEAPPSRAKTAEEWEHEAPVGGGYYTRAVAARASSAFDPSPSCAESFEEWLREVRGTRALRDHTIDARCRKLLEFMRKDPDPAVAPWAERLAIAIGVTKEPADASP